MFNEDRYEETMNEKVIEFGKPFAEAYSDLEDENNKLKYELEDIKTTNEANINVLRKLFEKEEEYISENERLKLELSQSTSDTKTLRKIVLELQSVNKYWKEGFYTFKKCYENVEAHYKELKSDFDRVIINYKDLKEKSLKLETAYLEQHEELKQAKEKEEEDRSWFAEMIRWFNKTRNDEVSKLKVQRNSLIKYYGNTSVHKVKQSEVAKIVELSEARISQIINTPVTDEEN